jgi:hypothetical protein
MRHVGAVLVWSPEVFATGGVGDFGNFRKQRSLQPRKTWKKVTTLSSYEIYNVKIALT